MRGLFNSCLGACSCAPFQFKLDGWNDGLAAAIVGGAASLGSSAISGIAANDLNEKNMAWQYKNMHEQMNFSHNEAEIARQHQHELLNAEQGWQERMYNLYNSPSAMMRQYREAGLNPYLVDAESSHGASMTSPIAPSTAQASAPSVGAPNTYMPDLSGIGRAGEMLLQAIGVSANASNQSAQGIHQVLENAKMMEAMNMPKDDIQRYMYSAFKEIKGANFDASRFVKQIDLDNQGKSINNDFNQLMLDIEKEFGRTERADKVMNMEQQFALVAAQIGRLAVQNKLDEATIDKFASEIARNFAAANLDNANAKLIRDSLTYLVNQAKYQAEIYKFSSQTAEGEYNLNAPIYEAAQTEVGQAAIVIDKVADKVVDKIGKVAKVNIGYSNNKNRSNTYFESQNKNWNVRSNFDYKHGITAP